MAQRAGTRLHRFDNTSVNMPRGAESVEWGKEFRPGRGQESGLFRTPRTTAASSPAHSYSHGPILQRPIRSCRAQSGQVGGSRAVAGPTEALGAGRSDADPVAICRPARGACTLASSTGGPPGQAGVYPQEGHRREAAPARHSGDRRQGAASPGGERAGAGVGGAVRAEVLRIPARPWLPRRDRGDLPGEQGCQPSPPVGARCGLGGGVRPDRPLLPAQPARHLPRQGTDSRVAESGGGRRWPVHPDRGGNSPGWGGQPRATERGAPRNGNSRRGLLPAQRQ